MPTYLILSDLIGAMYLASLVTLEIFDTMMDNIQAERLDEMTMSV
jgi:hypothetical protein